MVNYARWQRVITDEAGNIVPNVNIEVWSEATGLKKTLFADRTGGTPLSNSFTTGPDGLAAFHCVGDAVMVRAFVGPALSPSWSTTFRYEPVGTAAEYDIDQLMRVVPDGTVGAPGWAFALDQDTGIYRIASNQIGIAVGGVKMVDIAQDAVWVGRGGSVSTATQYLILNGSSAASQPAVFEVRTNNASRWQWGLMTGGGGLDFAWYRASSAIFAFRISNTDDSVSFNSTTTSTSTTSGAVKIAGGVGIGDNLRVANNVTVGNGGTAAATARALQIHGPDGAGSGSIFYFIKNNHVSGGDGFWLFGHASAVDAAGTSNNFKIATVGVGTAIEFNASTLAVTITGITTILTGAASTSTATGALVVVGGAGIGGRLNVGGAVTVTPVATGNPASSGTAQAALIQRFATNPAATLNNVLDTGGFNNHATYQYGMWLQTGNQTALGTDNAIPLVLNPLGNDTFVGGVLKLVANVASTSTTTGSLVVTGGIGVTGAAFHGGLISIASNSANALAVGANGQTNPALQVDASTASSATGLKVKSAAAAAGVDLSVVSSAANDNFTINAKGSGTIGIGSVSTGKVTVTPALDVIGQLTVASTTATPAGGSTAARLLFGTTAGFGIYYGSGAPTVSAGQGSIYLRSDGSSTSTRLYANTNGTTGWTNFTSAA